MFIEGQVYRRRVIHDMYGGNRQSGICPSAKIPYIFIFTGASGEQHGYQDRWLNEDVFMYSGEGQIGDMQFTRGNLALRNHLSQGKRVFLFEIMNTGMVKHSCELSFLDYDFYEAPDTSGNLRTAIIFYFRRLGQAKYLIPAELKNTTLAVDQSEPYEILKPNSTERSGLVSSRVGQGAFRKSILHRWSYRCAVTGYNDIRILIASHIQPWKDSTDEQRLDVENGILLSPDYDALFDKHLISFSSSGKILLSSELESTPIHLLGITGKESISNLSEGNKMYLEKHREMMVNVE